MGQNLSQLSATIPGKRPGRQTRSRQELNERISYVTRLLRICRTKGEVKRRIKAKYGCSGRTCETYLSRARLRSRKVPRHEDPAEERGEQSKRDTVAEVLAELGAQYGVQYETLAGTGP